MDACCCDSLAATGVIVVGGVDSFCGGVEVEELFFCLVLARLFGGCVGAAVGIGVRAGIRDEAEVEVEVDASDVATVFWD